MYSMWMWIQDRYETPTGGSFPSLNLPSKLRSCCSEQVRCSTTEGCECSMLEPMVQPRANPATPVHMHLPSSTAAIYIYCVHLASPSATSSTIPNLQQRCRRHNHSSYVCRTSEQGTTRLTKLRISSKCSSSCRYRGCAWCSKRTQRKRNNKDAKWRSLSRWVDYLSPAPAPAPASSLLPGSRFAAHLRQSLLT